LDLRDIIVVLTSGLPTSYETIIISLNTVDSKNITLTFVITCLLNEESCKNLAHFIVKLELEDKVNWEAMVAIAVKNIGTNVICFYCGGTGHFTTLCEVKMKHFKAMDAKFASIAISPDNEDDEVNYATQSEEKCIAISVLLKKKC
ncbi:hypothetical protein C0992_004813, partial [Termitomyces sp. T32_za158]